MWDKWQEAKRKVVAFEGEVPAPTPAMLARGKRALPRRQEGQLRELPRRTSGSATAPAAFKIDDHGEQGLRLPRRLGPRRSCRATCVRGSTAAAGVRSTSTGASTPASTAGRCRRSANRRTRRATRCSARDDMWALVHYVRSLSERDEARRPRGPEARHASGETPPRMRRRRFRRELGRSSSAPRATEGPRPQRSQPTPQSSSHRAPAHALPRSPSFPRPARPGCVDVHGRPQPRLVAAAERVDATARDIDRLFYLILWMVAFFFVLTEGILVWCVFAYSTKRETKADVHARQPQARDALDRDPGRCCCS